VTNIFQDAERILRNVAIDINNSNRIGTYDFFGCFKENREEEKRRGKENNGRGRLKGERPRAEG
jgi:hypothetical protein